MVAIIVALLLVVLAARVLFAVVAFFVKAMVVIVVGAFLLGVGHHQLDSRASRGPDSWAAAPGQEHYAGQGPQGRQVPPGYRMHDDTYRGYGHQDGYGARGDRDDRW